MSLFLDSNVLVWWLIDHRLSADVKDRIAAEAEVFVSVVSPWELWIKAQNGKLPLPADFEEALSEQQFSVISPTLEDARLAASLPPINRDPFNRMIVAQALNRRSLLVTGDRILGDYGVRTLIV